MSNLTAQSTLRETLEALTKEHLQPRAQLCAKNLPTRKGELIEVIVSTLHSPEGLQKIWRQLDVPSQQVIAAALENNGQFDAAGFRAQHGQVPWDALKKRNPWMYSDQRTSYLPVEVLLYDGRIPSDLVPLLKPLAPSFEKFVIPGTATLPAEDVEALLVAETEAAALHDLVATLSFVAEGKAASTPKTGRPTAATVATLAERLLQGEFLPPRKKNADPEPIRAFGWLELAQAARLVKAAGSKLTLTPKGQRALIQPDPDLLREVFEKWQHANEFDELRRITALRGQGGRRTHLTRPAERKRALLKALAQCPPGQWLAREDFFRAVRAWQCNFEVQNSYYDYGIGGLYVGDSWEYGYLSGFGDEAEWRATQAQYILVCLFEYLATLGALDIAYDYPDEVDFPLDHLAELDGGNYFSAYVGLCYFRINALGAYLLGMSQAYAGPARPVAQPVFTVTANHEVAITHREQFTPNVRNFLERLAEPASEGIYSLDRAKVLTALETGLTLEAITEFLADKSAQPLPQTVRIFLDDLQRNSRALKEGGAAVLFTALDAPLAHLLVNDSTLRKFCSLIEENTIVVPADKEAAFRRRVKQLGFGIRR